MSVRKLSLSGILIAVGVVCSTFYIPVGVSKVFPIQHFINVLAGVVLGPLYAVCTAFVTSFLRVTLGTGSLLAFPGSMCGALLCGLAYKYKNKIIMAFLGEVIGTGVIGAILAYPIALLFLGSKATAFAFMIPFTLSSFTGAMISFILLAALKKTGIIKYFVLKEQNFEI